MIVLKHISVPPGTRQLDVTAGDDHRTVRIEFRGDSWTASVDGWEHRWTWQVLKFKDELPPLNADPFANPPIAYTAGTTNQRPAALTSVADTLTEILEDPSGRLES